VAMAIESPGAMNPCEVGGEHAMATKWKRQGDSTIKERDTERGSSGLATAEKASQRSQLHS
jgi:hypothetical protein